MTSALSKREVFSRSVLFAALSAEELESLISLAVERTYRAGEVLFEEGMPCEGLYVLASGTVKISKASPSGRSIMLAMETAPSTVAEVPLFDGGDYPASVSAVEDTVAYLLPKDAFRRFCESHPKVPLKVLAVAGQRLRQLVRLVETVTFGSMRQRVARALLDFAEQSGQAEFELPVTHEELALRLGTVREVVSRNLARFQAEGMIRIAKRQVLVVDRDALRAEAETDL
jgi:CRP-like cAMP-binding protein